VIDGTPPAIGSGDAVTDEALVQGKVRERAFFGQPVGRSWPRCYAVIGGPHGSRWLVGGLPAEPSAIWFAFAVEVAG
jgi:hypothetical protein